MGLILHVMIAAFGIFIKQNNFFLVKLPHSYDDQNQMFYVAKTIQWLIQKYKIGNNNAKWGSPQAKFFFIPNHIFYPIFVM
jgi:hypothetical protein